MVRTLALALIAAALAAVEPAADPAAAVELPASEAGWRCPLRAAAIIGQGNGEAFSHTDRWNRFAWDYAVAVGTPVVAARSGVVIAARGDSAIGGDDVRFLTDANKVVIRHSDGSRSLYLHLAKDGAWVRPGEFVLRGEQIGLSGDTGFTSGPHLHFTATNALGISIAIAFADFAVNAGIPARGDVHGPAAPPLVPQDAISACKRLLRAARRAQQLDRPDLGYALLAPPVTGRNLAGYVVADQLAAYRASFQARTAALIAGWEAAPLDDPDVALAAKQAALALAALTDAQPLLARLAAREQRLPPELAGSLLPAAGDLLAAAKADCAGDAAAASTAYLAASRHGAAARAASHDGLERLLTAYLGPAELELARLDDESARCRPAHRGLIRRDGEAAARFCLGLAGCWPGELFPDQAPAEALRARTQAALARIQAHVGRR